MAPCWSFLDLLIGFGLAWTSPADRPTMGPLPLRGPPHGVVLLLLAALHRLGLPWSDLWHHDDDT